jgi:aryl-alcohol dehydrogenase-like predicted oxidoreductase
MSELKNVASIKATKPVPSPTQGPFSSRRRELWPEGPWVSAIGFGSYRIGLHPSLGYPECESALEGALQKGMNLIDTSANYGNGLSEILIGRVLKKLFAEGSLKREQVVLVSKVGYVQGSNMEMASAREWQGNPFPDMNKFGQDVWHCIHPEYIRDQIERSLQRLGVAALDAYLLHNPEYALKKFEMDGVPVEEARNIFYARIKSAFAELEKLVQEGKIASYGISSNTFGAPLDDYSAVCIKRCWNVAQEISQNSNFKVVQLPFNWIEVSPAFLDYDGTQVSTIAFAQEKKLGVLVNRPLNAMYNDRLLRLTRPVVTPEEVANLDEGKRKGLENWAQLAEDLEALAKQQIDTPGYEDAPLSQLVLSTLAWCPGVTSVLCGVRKTKYVDDAEEAMRRPKIIRARENLADIFQNLEFHKG